MKTCPAQACALDRDRRKHQGRSKLSKKKKKYYQKAPDAADCSRLEVGNNDETDWEWETTRVGNSHAPKKVCLG